MKPLHCSKGPCAAQSAFVRRCIKHYSHAARHASASTTRNLSCQTLNDAISLLQGDRLFSQAHDELYQFSFERRRWGPLALRPPRADRKREAAAAQEQRDPPAAADASAGGDAAEAVAAALEQRTADSSGAAQPSGLLC